MMRDHVCVGSKAVKSDVWWERDGYGIPLALVCKDCRAEKMSHYRSDIQERYETDEQIESEEEIRDTDGAWEDDCYSRDLEW